MDSKLGGFSGQQVPRFARNDKAILVNDNVTLGSCELTAESWLSKIVRTMPHN
jgi:hypothetical protein